MPTRPTPDAKLFYNDYGTTETNKREKIYVLLEDLLAEGVPVHGIGMQAHWDITSPSVSQLEAAIRRYASLGLEVQITELDISLYGWSDKRRFINDPEELKRTTGDAGGTIPGYLCGLPGIPGCDYRRDCLGFERRPDLEGQSPGAGKERPAAHV